MGLSSSKNKMLISKYKDLDRFSAKFNDQDVNKAVKFIGKSTIIDPKSRGVPRA